MVELADAVGHAASAAGGGVTIGWIAKFLIQNWIKAHDSRADKIGEALEKVAAKLGSIAVELGKVEVRLGALETSAAKAGEFGEKIAILGTRLTTAERNLNGLGQKLRSRPNGD